ncbi:hypothetical protein EHS39_11410 [Ensifer sp. MPMI2T]|nr:hypothetical protein EHS39_11410 [Ensifer sp. MPMI2T]
MNVRFVRRETAEKLSKFRVHTWMDTNTFEPVYGVEANVDKGKWAHVVADCTPLLFNTAAEAKAEIKKLKAAA